MEDTALRTFDIYTIDTKVTNIDGSHALEKRTEKPLSLLEAQKEASKWFKKGHVVEFRAVKK
jgi:hypothetical protein